MRVFGKTARRGDPSPFDALWEHALFGILVADVLTDTVRCNRRMEEMWDSPCPATFAELAEWPRGRRGGRLPEGPYELIMRVLARGDAVEAEESIVERADGGHAVILTSVGPMTDAEGTVTGVVVTSVDITAQRTAEQQAHARAHEAAALTAELNTLLESIPDAIYIGDISGILRCNRVALEMLGYDTPEELNRSIGVLAQEIDTRVPATDEVIPAHDQPFAHALRGEAVTREVVVRNRKTGDRRVVRSAAAPIRQDGRVVGAVAINSDITDEVRVREERIALLERERRARADAEAANRAKDEFLAVVSHELRQPLNSILGRAAMLKAGVLSPEAAVIALEKIERAANTQLRLVADLMDTARIIRGDLSLRRAEVDVAGVIARAIEAVRQTADHKHVSLNVAIDDRVTTIDADPERLQQVVWNLVANAVKFTPEDGWVTVAASVTGPDLVLTITDSGVGIAADLLPLIFDRFQQGHQPAGSADSGLGLGLAIARHIVEAHGGSIAAYSDGPGRGAQFVVTLPLRR